MDRQEFDDLRVGTVILLVAKVNHTAYTYVKMSKHFWIGTAISEEVLRNEKGMPIPTEIMAPYVLGEKAVWVLLDVFHPEDVVREIFSE